LFGHERLFIGLNADWFPCDVRGNEKFGKVTVSSCEVLGGASYLLIDLFSHKNSQRASKIA